MGSKRLGAVGISIVVLAAVGVVAAGISGVMLSDPTSEFSDQGESSADYSQCQIWKNQTQTAGIDDRDDEYERKYNNQCNGADLDQQKKNGNFLSEEYNASDHTANFEEATSECRIGECRSQSVCIANGANIGESCGIGGTCCTLQENKEIEYEESEGNAGDVSESDDDFINDPSDPDGGDGSGGEYDIDYDDKVNLGEEGLSEGDRIGPYIEPHIQSNTLIEIPAGSYRWDDSSVFNIGDISNFGIVGKGGDVVLRQPEKDMTVGLDATSGTVKIKNLRFANTVSGGSHQYSAEEGATIVLDNYQRPDGTSGGGIGILIPMDHAGTAIVNNAHIENFPNNGLYASGPGYKCPEQNLQGNGGVVKVYGGLFKNNNIANVRVGSDNTVVRNTDIVVDQRSTSYVTAYNMRGIWVRGDGRDVSIDNVDIDYTHTGEGSTYPIIIQPQCGGNTVSSGQILDSSIETNSDFDALRRDHGDWTCQNTEITGNGNTNSDLQC